MSNKHMKRCSALLITREMHIKTILRSEWPSSKNVKKINAGEDVGKKGIPLALLVGM